MRPTTRVTDTLRNAIINGEFMPNERLVEIELAERCGTTRAQIRSSLAALEGEGLVVSEPNRGARVRRISPAEALEITEARASLEALVAAKAAENATDDDISKLNDILERMHSAHDADDLLGYSSLNGELHKEIRRISAHSVANKMLATLNSQIVRYQFSAIMIPGRATKSLSEHMALVDAIRRHDAERARDAMNHHLSHVAVALRQAIAVQEVATSFVPPRIAVS